MTPEEARAKYETMDDDDKARVSDFVRSGKPGREAVRLVISSKQQDAARSGTAAAPETAQEVEPTTGESIGSAVMGFANRVGDFAAPRMDLEKDPVGAVSTLVTNPAGFAAGAARRLADELPTAKGGTVGEAIADARAQDPVATEAGEWGAVAAQTAASAPSLAKGIASLPSAIEDLLMARVGARTPTGMSSAQRSAYEAKPEAATAPPRQGIFDMLRSAVGDAGGARNMAGRVMAKKVPLVGDELADAQFPKPPRSPTASVPRDPAPPSNPTDEYQAMLREQYGEAAPQVIPHTARSPLAEDELSAQLSRGFADDVEEIMPLTQQKAPIDLVQPKAQAEQPYTQIVVGSDPPPMTPLDRASWARRPPPRPVDPTDPELPPNWRDMPDPGGPGTQSATRGVPQDRPPEYRAPRPPLSREQLEAEVAASLSRGEPEASIARRLGLNIRDIRPLRQAQQWYD